MKIQELRIKSEEELKKLLQESRERLRVLTFDLAQGKVKNTQVLQETRHDIARTLTVLSDLAKNKN